MIDALKYFRIEAREYIDGLRTDLLRLEREQDDAECIRTLFRLAHTLKGSSRMVGLEPIGSIAHKIEDILVAVRDEGVRVTGETISTMLAAVDAIEQLLDAAGGEAPATVDPEQVVAALDTALKEGAPAAETVRKRQKKTSVRSQSGKPKTPPRATKSSGQAKPAAHKKSTGKKSDGEKPAQTGVISKTIANKSTVSVAETASPTGPSSAEEGQLRVSLGKIDHLTNLTGELIIQKIRMASHSNTLRVLTQDVQRLVRTVHDIQDWSSAVEVQETLENTPAGSRLAAILERTRFVALREGWLGVAGDAKGQVAQLDQVVSALHDSVMDLRMLPASILVTPLQLVTRETARELGRQVRLEVVGEDVEIDKALLEGIKDPLSHLIRNAVGHGIEDPDERKAAGKPPEGVILLVFEQRGARLSIGVTDDGRGVDTEKVRETVVMRGILEPAAAAAMDAPELLKQLLKPGFSTASEVTQIAGRGVGLDVVATCVRELTGTMELESMPGDGMSVRMQLPVNLSTMEGFLFQSDLRTYALPLESVIQVRHINPGDIHACAHTPVLQVEGETLPFSCMSQLLDPTAVPHCAEAAIIEVGGEKMGLGIDRVVGVHTLIIKPLPPHVGELPWVSGITVLAGGSPAVILDVSRLFSEAGRAGDPAVDSGRVEALPDPQSDTGADTPQAPADVSHTVLVVDDSLSARMMQKGMLESAGYHVVLAADGAEALAKLARGDIDLIVSDVEMPRMTGLDLLKQVREQSTTRNLPVIIVSSMGSRRDRKHGQDAGANEYLVKQELNQKSLLAAVARLVGR